PAELSDAQKKLAEELAMPVIKGLIPGDDKTDLYGGIDDLKSSVAEKLCEANPELEKGVVKDYVGKLVKKYARQLTMEGRRVDGRDTETIRPIICKTDLFPRVHGSALFTRGQTQVVSVVTLGSGDDRQRIDT